MIIWPHALLKPSQIMPNPVAFTQNGGRSFGGMMRTARTDKGHWSISYKGVSLGSEAQRRRWNSIRTTVNGMFGLIAIPVWSNDSLDIEAVVEMALAASLGGTSVTLRAVSDVDDLSGIHFSYGHALYETGIATSNVGDLWTVPIFPAIRAAIPADAALEVAMPTCLVHLATDREMDVKFSAGNFDRVDVAFVEAVEYWSDLA